MNQPHLPETADREIVVYDGRPVTPPAVDQIPLQRSERVSKVPMRFDL